MTAVRSTCDRSGAIDRRRPWLRHEPLAGRDAAPACGRGAFQRLRRNPSAIIGAVIVALFVLVAVFAPLLAPYEPATSEWIEPGHPERRARAVSPEHPLGLDSFGSDLLTQLIYGARQSLVIGVVSTMLGADRRRGARRARRRRSAAGWTPA